MALEHIIYETHAFCVHMVHPYFEGIKLIYNNKMTMMMMIIIIAETAANNNNTNNSNQHDNFTIRISISISYTIFATELFS